MGGDGRVRGTLKGRDVEWWIHKNEGAKSAEVYKANRTQIIHFLHFHFSSIFAFISTWSSKGSKPQHKVPQPSHITKVHFTAQMSLEVFNVKGNSYKSVVQTHATIFTYKHSETHGFYILFSLLHPTF